MKSQLPNPHASPLQPAVNKFLPDGVQDEAIAPSVTNGAGHDVAQSTESASSADEAWWRTFTLNSREAAAGSPMGYAACGEEDPGAGLELLVSQKRRRTSPP